jgi:hypothetical protein
MTKAHILKSHLRGNVRPECSRRGTNDRRLGYVLTVISRNRFERDFISQSSKRIAERLVGRQPTLSEITPPITTLRLSAPPLP